MSKINNKFKKIISLTIGVPAAVVVVSELENPNYWYVQFIALGIAIAVLCWDYNALLGSKERSF